MKRTLQHKNESFKGAFQSKKYHDIIFKAFMRLPYDSQEHFQAVYGMNRQEPIVELFHNILQYIDAYQACYNAKIAEDGVIGASILKILEGTRELLDGQGAVAMQYENSSDSKSNGMLYEVYTETLKLGGYSIDT